ncbi:hypothetical protein INT46_004668 [Mucor plumbeus]|uniref:Uncharacterized protein n=1 Tax=Mucor plumbeus TaxID=97098 RepID=A0A8H7V3T9_9FUNG|nr:hypothetical protein INT46_004668 [Mucor plumbeus]
MKQEKKEAKQQKTNNTNAVFSNCKEVGHSSSRSPLLNNRKATNGTALPSDMIPAWDTFRIKYPTIIYKVNLASGNSQCISEAYTVVATSYLNNIVELFKAKVLRYICYILQNAFMTMSPDHVAKIAKEFCYQMVYQGNPVWPKNIQLSEGEQSRIKEACIPLSTHIDVQVTLKSLSASPEKFVRSLAYILPEYEREHLAHNPYDVRRLSLPRLFTISPSPSFRWKFVTIIVNSLCCFTKEKLPRGYNAQLDLFYKYFDFKGLGFKSIDDLRPNGLNNVLFSNTIKSDGFTVDFLFEKRRATALKEVKKDIENHDLVLEDFEYEEVERIYQPVFIDPGRKAVYTAAIGLDTSNHQIRQYSIKEYYNLTGSTKYSSRSQKLKDSKGLTSIETNIPTQKKLAVQLCMIDLSNISLSIKINYSLSMTKRKKWRKIKKAAKKSNERLDRKARAKKKINDNDVSSTVGAHDITKPNKWKPAKFEYDKSKVSLIVFGTGMVGKDSVKLRGLTHGVTGMFYRALKKREKKGKLLVVPIDEFKTSRICNICKTDTLYKASHTRSCL